MTIILVFFKLLSVYLDDYALQLIKPPNACSQNSEILAKINKIDFLIHKWVQEVGCIVVLQQKSIGFKSWSGVFPYRVCRFSTRMPGLSLEAPPTVKKNVTMM